MTFEKLSNGYGCSLIEQKPHLWRECRSLVKTTGRELDYGLNLLSVDPVKPLHKIINTGPGFKILKNRGHGHARPAQYPGTTDLAGNALHGGAC